MASQSTVVAVTDQLWFEYLSSIAVGGRLDEVNFWRPLSQKEFKALQPGEPFFFRLKHPFNAIAGYGYFVHDTKVPLRLAWDAFQERNGDPTFDRFVRRIADYRGQTPAGALFDARDLTCLVLREVRFFERIHWVTWGEDREWQRQIVTYKVYDLTKGAGLYLGELLRNHAPAELTHSFEPVITDSRLWAQQAAVVREGQGAFRVRVLDAYGRRCAVTGEHALPVLDAAHIQPYLGPSSNHVQNGLSLRADIHRLYDIGYVTVTPEYRFEVSRRLKDDFDNGKPYYELEGARLTVVPDDPSQRPSRAALEWHAANVFH
jgi:putative restriction endonuclease